MTAREVKDALYARHPASRSPMPGPWTVTEEYNNIDLLAISAWSSASRFARVGYEVKVSRQDLRNELLRPGKRAFNVAWCHEFYLATPAGLITQAELTYEEPEWEGKDFIGIPCEGYLGQRCRRNYSGKTYRVLVPKPSTSEWDTNEYVICPTCLGKGVTSQSRVEEEAPYCWLPRDLGLVVVHPSGRSEVIRISPRRKEVPMLTDRELGQLIRWVSIRPDPRHHPQQSTTLEVVV